MVDTAFGVAVHFQGVVVSDRAKQVLTRLHKRTDRAGYMSFIVEQLSMW